MLEKQVSIITLDTTERLLADAGSLNTTFYDNADFKFPAEMFKSWDHARRLKLLNRAVDLLKVFGLLRVICPNGLGVEVTGTLAPAKLYGTNLAVVFLPDLVQLEDEHVSMSDAKFQARTIFVHNSSDYQLQEATAIAQAPSGLWTANASAALNAYRFYNEYPVIGEFPQLLLKFGQYHGLDASGVQLIPQYTWDMFKYQIEWVGDKPAIVYGPAENPWLLKMDGRVGQWRVYRRNTMALVVDESGFGMAMEDLRKVCTAVTTQSAPDQGLYL